MSKFGQAPTFPIQVHLRYAERDYIFSETGYYDMDHVRYMYKEGNFSCDCNKSLFIQQLCDEEFPEFECGNLIELVSVEEKKDASI